MKLHVELALGVAVFAATLLLLTPKAIQPTKPSSIAQPEIVVDGAPAPLSPHSRATKLLSHAPSAPGDALLNSVVDIVARNEMSTLYNAVLAVSGHPNGVMECLRGVELASAMRLRFAVDVEATPHLATTGAWRFVEIVDGQQLPEAFAACAARALGGNLRVTPPSGSTFPTFRGELTTLYRTPEPPSFDKVQVVEGVDATNR